MSKRKGSTPKPKPKPPPPTPREPGLTAKQRAFVVEYCVDWNATKAAERAGYAPATAFAEGWRLLRNVKVRQAVAARTAIIADTAEIDGARVLLELTRIGYADLRGAFVRVAADAAAGVPAYTRLVDPLELPDRLAPALSAIEVVTRKAEGGEVEYVHKLKLADKGKALELLAKRLGLLVEKVEHGTIGSAIPVRIVNEHHPTPSRTAGR